MASLIPEEKIAELKNRADIVDVIAETVLLRKAGTNYVGLCPFHSEKAPSFTVNREKQIFYCFGCQTGGNVFSFLMKKEGLSFPESVRFLARKYGVEIPVKAASPDEKRRMDEKERIFHVNRLALDFFRERLMDPRDGQPALKYLKNRGFEKRTLDAFAIGYAPPGWENLSRFLARKGIPPAMSEKSGLVVPGKSGKGCYDRFRGRIIFPIFDLAQRVIGFGGRVMDDSLPKYLNSPETPVYNKRRSLYGLHAAKQPCRETERVFVVEGYFDLIALHQHGIEDVVASLGTSFTREHIRLLKGFAKEAFLVFDSDEAGIKAAVRTVGLLLDEGVEASVIVLPEGSDPDSFIFKHDRSAFLDAADRALGVMAFLIDTALKKHGKSIEGKVRVVHELSEPIASISDSVARSLYIRELSERIGIDERTILEKVRQQPVKRAVRPGSDTASAVRANGGEIDGAARVRGVAWKLEKRLIAMMLQHPRIISKIQARGIMALFEDAKLKAIGEILLGFASQPDVSVRDVLEKIPNEKWRNFAASLAMENEPWDEEGCFRLVQQYEKQQIKEGSKLIQKIRQAEADGNQELLIDLLREKQALVRQRRIDTAG